MRVYAGNIGEDKAEELVEDLENANIGTLRFLIKELRETRIVKGGLFAYAWTVYSARIDRLVLADIRPGDYPRVVCIQVDDEQELVEGSQLVNLKKLAARTLSRDYGVDLRVVYYSDKTEPEKIQAAIEAGNFMARDKARVIAFSNKGSYALIDGALAKYREEGGGPISGKVSGIVKADLAVPGGNREARFSHVNLALFGMGLIEYQELVKKIKTKEIDESNPRFKSLSEALFESFVNIDTRGLAMRSMNPASILNQIINGTFELKIQRIDYEEVRNYMESESEVLESL
jgi:hypothetical protein